MISKASAIAFASVASCLLSPWAMADETGLAGIHEQRQEGNRICMSSHFHSGSSSGHKTRKQAEAAAVHDWAGFTAWEYGTDWASYRLAASKTMECSQAGGAWRCHVDARPCKRPTRKRR